MFYLSESTINDYIILQEKKTREQYAREKFKKKYNFKPDKPGSDTGTITVDGKPYKVDMKKSKTMDVYNAAIGADQQTDRQTSADLNSKEKKINLDNNFFKLKGSNKGERRDAILKHEIGHANMHGIYADKNMKSPNILKKTLTKTMKDNAGIDLSDDKQLKFFGSSGHDLRKQAYDAVNMKDYAKNSPNKQERKGRESSYKAAEKYENNGIHAHAHEFEADRYAANRTSERAVKKGVANAYKLIKQDYKNNPDIKKMINKSASNDMKQRSKALKDKDLRSSKYYK